MSKRLVVVWIAVQVVLLSVALAHASPAGAMYVEGTFTGYSRLFQHFGTSAQANPPFLTSLPTVTLNANGTTSAPAPTPSGPAPYGYVTALQGVTP